MSTTTDQILDRAADLIAERGWVHGEGWNELDNTDRPLCLEGGIMAAMGTTLDELITDSRRQRGSHWRQPFETCPAYAAVTEYLAAHHDVLVMQLCSWNDHYAKDADEVIDVLRRAAKYVREQEQSHDAA